MRMRRSCARRTLRLSLSWTAFPGRIMNAFREQLAVLFGYHGCKRIRIGVFLHTSVPVISEKDCELFSKGIHYTVYEKLGAHILKQNGTEGTLFAVCGMRFPSSSAAKYPASSSQSIGYSPPFSVITVISAMRVSVVGNFNQWDGRRHQMRRLGDSGIFELFDIPRPSP